MPGDKKLASLLKMIRQSAQATPNKGMDDQVTARLSPGEYVIDAQTVSLLGDGDSKAGSAVLDRVIEAIRKQKGIKSGKQPKKLAEGGPPVPSPVLGKGGPIPFAKGGRVPKSYEGLLRILGVL